MAMSMHMAIEHTRRFYNFSIAWNRRPILLRNVFNFWEIATTSILFCWDSLERSQLLSVFWQTEGRRYPMFLCECKLNWHIDSALITLQLKHKGVNVEMWSAGPHRKCVAHVISFELLKLNPKNMNSHIKICEDKFWYSAQSPRLWMFLWTPMDGYC